MSSPLAAFFSILLQQAGAGSVWGPLVSTEQCRPILRGLFGSALGVTGLHKVRPRVQFEEHRTIPPPDLFPQYSDLRFWKNPNLTTASFVTAAFKDS